MAAMILHKPEAEVTDEDRAVKRSFRLIYGQSLAGLSEELNFVDFDRANDPNSRHLVRIHDGIMDQTARQQASRRRYLETLYGRRPSLSKAYTGTNLHQTRHYDVQSTSSFREPRPDMFELDVHGYPYVTPGPQDRLLLPLHDAILLECLEESGRGAGRLRNAWEHYRQTSPCHCRSPFRSVAPGTSSRRSAGVTNSNVVQTE